LSLEAQKQQIEPQGSNSHIKIKRFNYNFITFDKTFNRNMKKEQYYAVITGDIVNSTKLNKMERENVLKFIKDIFKKIEQEEGKITKLQMNYAITRGDSFQVIIRNPQNILKYSILLRSGLRGLFQKDISELCDARISIGIGSVDYWGETVSESDGSAFRYSGRNLDITKSKKRFLIETFDKDLNKELEVYLILLDSIIKDWTFSMAQIIFEKILEPKQLNIVEKIGISASAISRRLNSAHWDSIVVLLNRFETVIN